MISVMRAVVRVFGGRGRHGKSRKNAPRKTQHALGTNRRRKGRKDPGLRCGIASWIEQRQYPSLKVPYRIWRPAGEWPRPFSRSHIPLLCSRSRIPTLASCLPAARSCNLLRAKQAAVWGQPASKVVLLVEG